MRQKFIRIILMVSTIANILYPEAAEPGYKAHNYLRPQSAIERQFFTIRDTKAFGNWMRQRRHEKQLTQEKLAKRIGTSNDMISRWETRRYKPPKKHIAALERELGSIPENLKEKVDITDIGSWIKAKRIELGLTQEELAKRIGTSNDMISRWETGRRKPPQKHIAALEEMLGSILPDHLREGATLGEGGNHNVENLLLTQI